MKKMFLIITCLLFCANLSYSACAIENTNTVCTATDAARIREPYKQIYRDYSGNADFNGEPFIRISPADRSSVERTFKDHNELQNQSQYDSNCQFGVCLPSDMTNNSMQ